MESVVTSLKCDYNCCCCCFELRYNFFWPLSVRALTSSQRQRCRALTGTRSPYLRKPTPAKVVDVIMSKQQCVRVDPGMVCPKAIGNRCNQTRSARLGRLYPCTAVFLLGERIGRWFESVLPEATFSD